MNVVKVFCCGAAGLAASAALFAADPVFTITIERNMTCADKSVIGRLLVNDAEIGRTLELPWRNNEKGISCVDAGTYPATIRADGTLGWRVELIDESGNRKNIQLHVGNYQRQIKGCVLVGDDVTVSNGECMVPNSRATLNRLADAMAAFAGDGLRSNEIDIEVVIRDAATP